MPYGKFVGTRIFQPLGTKDSYIFLPAEKQSRLAAVYTLKGAKMIKAGNDILGGNPFSYRHDANILAPNLPSIPRRRISLPFIR